jgi:protein-S-isoprenylcysteine O-methyltransferase Ste14
MTTGFAVHPALWLCALNLLLVAALPRIFFRPGRLNLNWWLTAAPFLVAATGLVQAAVTGAAVQPALHLVAVPLAAASIFLIGLALGSHREPVSLWHQEDDAPRGIVVNGAYRHVRHPFYAAFLLALAASALAAPGLLTGAALLAAAMRLHATAVREERRLLASSLGPGYRAYMARTGRFLPRRVKRERAVSITP